MPDDTKSNLPSPLKSPTFKSTEVLFIRGWEAGALKVPSPFPFSTDRYASVTTTSVLPSRSKSPTTIEDGPEPGPHLPFVQIGGPDVPSLLPRRTFDAR